VRCWDERAKAFAVSSVLDHCFSTTVLRGLPLSIFNFFTVIKQTQLMNAVNWPLPHSDSGLARRRMLHYRLNLLRATETSARQWAVKVTSTPNSSVDGSAMCCTRTRSALHKIAGRYIFRPGFALEAVQCVGARCSIRTLCISHMLYMKHYHCVLTWGSTNGGSADGGQDSERAHGDIVLSRSM